MRCADLWRTYLEQHEARPWHLQIFFLLHYFQLFQCDHTPRTLSAQTKRGNQTHSSGNALTEAKTVFSVGKCHFPSTAGGAQSDPDSSGQVRAVRVISGINDPAGWSDDESGTTDVSDGLRVMISPHGFSTEVSLRYWAPKPSSGRTRTIRLLFNPGPDPTQRSCLGAWFLPQLHRHAPPLHVQPLTPAHRRCGVRLPPRRAAHVVPLRCDEQLLDSSPRS